MTVTITAGSLTIPAPAMVLEASQDRHSTAANVFHDLIGGGLAVTLRAAQARTGELKLLYATRAAADETEVALRSATLLTYADTDPEFTLRFAVDGTISLAQAAIGNTDYWVLSFGYREV